ncbi:hypothetical protein SESBI_17345 [Sesbania bispinosa]|nr:hypothetical protein SESBI_17345 [Sesbania bispinosa]
MEEVRARVETFIKGEESNKEKRRKETNEDSRGRLSRLDVAIPSKSKGRPFKCHPQGDKRKREWTNLDSLTSLTVEKGQILRKVFHTKLLQFPPPSRTARGPDKEKWCEFHWASGHNTKECWTLVEQIEELIEQGHLQKYIAR